MWTRCWWETVSSRCYDASPFRSELTMPPAVHATAYSTHSRVQWWRSAATKCVESGSLCSSDLWQLPLWLTGTEDEVKLGLQPVWRCNNQAAVFKRLNRIYVWWYGQTLWNWHSIWRDSTPPCNCPSKKSSMQKLTVRWDYQFMINSVDETSCIWCAPAGTTLRA